MLEYIQSISFSFNSINFLKSFALPQYKKIAEDGRKLLQRLVASSAEKGRMLLSQEKRKQWHQGFYGAAELEFDEDSDNLVFDKEHYLSKEPIRMDMLVIKKLKDKPIKNEIGHIFKKHNVIEYKSPDDGLTIDDYYKAIAYASLYKSLANKVDEIKAEDITITLIRERYPRELIKALQKEGKSISEVKPGIYYVKEAIFDIQIIVTSKLDKSHSWLRVLSANVKEEDISNFAEKSKDMISQGQKNNVDVIYQISVSANMQVYDDLKRRRPEMCEALQILLKDEIEQWRIEAHEEGIQRGYESGQRDGYESGQREGYESGQREGYESGKRAVASNVAIKMIKSNYIADTIIEMTGLSMEALETLSKENGLKLIK